MVGRRFAKEKFRRELVFEMSPWLMNHATALCEWVCGMMDWVILRKTDSWVGPSAAPAGLGTLPTPTPGLRPGLLSDAPPALGNSSHRRFGLYVTLLKEPQ